MNQSSYRPRAVAALASFVITLALFQGVASLAAPSVAPAVQLAKLTAGETLR